MSLIRILSCIKQPILSHNLRLCSQRVWHILIRCLSGLAITRCKTVAFRDKCAPPFFFFLLVRGLTCVLWQQLICFFPPEPNKTLQKLFHMLSSCQQGQRIDSKVWRIGARHKPWVNINEIKMSFTSVQHLEVFWEPLSLADTCPLITVSTHFELSFTFFSWVCVFNAGSWIEKYIWNTQTFLLFQWLHFLSLSVSLSFQLSPCYPPLSGVFSACLPHYVTVCLSSTQRV